MLHDVINMLISNFVIKMYAAYSLSLKRAQCYGRKRLDFNKICFHHWRCGCCCNLDSKI